MFQESEEADEGDCEHAFDGESLIFDATACPGRGDLLDEQGCRASVVASLRDRSAEEILGTNPSIWRPIRGYSSSSRPVARESGTRTARPSRARRGGE